MDNQCLAAMSEHVYIVELQWEIPNQNNCQEKCVLKGQTMSSHRLKSLDVRSRWRSTGSRMQRRTNPLPLG